jgi:hypothetical protein
VLREHREAALSERPTAASAGEASRRPAAKLGNERAWPERPAAKQQERETMKVEHRGGI